MKKLFKATWAAATAMTLVAASIFSAPISAQDAPQPAIVVSVASLQEQLDDIGYLLDGSGFGQFKFMMNMQAKEFLKGVAMDRPAGALLYFGDDAMTPTVVGFIPVSNLDDLTGVIGGFADIGDEDGLITVGLDDGTTVYAKEDSGYVFVSDKSENLEELPSDPLVLIGELPTKYNVAARLFGDRIPESTRSFLIDNIRQGFESSLENMDDELADLQRANMEMQLEQIESLINETEEVEFGFDINKAGNSLVFEARLVGKEGSRIAEQVAAAKDQKTRFAGFLIEGTAFHGVSCSAVAADDLPALEKMLENLKTGIEEKLGENDKMSDEEREAVIGLLHTAFDTLESTAAAGKFDIGIVGTTDDGQINIAMGLETADPKALEEEIKKVVPLAQKRADDKLDVKLNAFTAAGANFHEFKVAVPESEEEARKLFGEQLTLNVGFGKDVAFVGLGANSVDLIKKAMSSSGSPPADLPMTKFDLYLTPILELIASMQDDATVKKMAAKLKEVGKDKISIEGRAIENGMMSRLEIQDGFLQLIQIAAEQFGGGPPRDF